MKGCNINKVIAGFRYLMKLVSLPNFGELMSGIPNALGVTGMAMVCVVGLMMLAATCLLAISSIIVATMQFTIWPSILLADNLYFCNELTAWGAISVVVMALVYFIAERYINDVSYADTLSKLVDMVNSSYKVVGGFLVIAWGVQASFFFTTNIVLCSVLIGAAVILLLSIAVKQLCKLGNLYEERLK